MVGVLGAEMLHLTPFSLHAHCQGAGTTLRICICQSHAALACQVSPQQDPEGHVLAPRDTQVT